MEYLILFAIIIAYSSLSSKISRIMYNMPNMDNMSNSNKKRFPSLKELVGKNIEIETDEYLELSYGYSTKGLLKEYNDTWLVIESRDKKDRKELYYYRIKNITSINVIDN